MKKCYHACLNGLRNSEPSIGNELYTKNLSDSVGYFFLRFLIISITERSTPAPIKL